MSDLNQYEDETTEEYIERLKDQARKTPLKAPVKQEVISRDGLAVFLNLNHLLTGENPLDYGFRGMIPLITDGVDAEEKRRVRITKDKPASIPATLAGNVVRGFLKIENRTGIQRGMLAKTAPSPEDTKQVILLKDVALNTLAVIRPGTFYFGEPPEGELFLWCAGSEATASYVAFPGSI